MRFVLWREKINYKGYSCMCPKCDGEGKIITGQKTKLSREIQRPREITSVKVSFSINGLSVRYKVNGHNVPEDELFCIYFSFAFFLASVKANIMSSLSLLYKHRFYLYSYQ